jgi:hypothetical protein
MKIITMNFKQLNFLEFNAKWENDQLKVLKTAIYNQFHSYNALGEYIKNRTGILTDSDEELFEIIYSIQKWGGATGRYFFIKRNGISYFESFKKDKSQIAVYRNAVKLAMQGDPFAFDLFCQIKGINASFAGKHAYFWSPSSNPLIIVDKLIANYFEFETPQALLKETGGYSNLYKLFLAETRRLNLPSILVLERGIFQFMREKQN